jgi:hypothetical protein
LYRREIDNKKSFQIGISPISIIRSEIVGDYNNGIVSRIQMASFRNRLCNPTISGKRVGFPGFSNGEWSKNIV